MFEEIKKWTLTKLFTPSMSKIYKTLPRELTEKEVNFVEDRLGDYIDWYDSICFVLNDLDK